MNLMKNVIVLLLIITILLIRPAILGEVYTPIGVILSSLGLIFYVIYRKREINIYKYGLSIYIINLFYWGYLLVQTVILSSTAYDIVINGLIINGIVIFAFVTILSDVAIRYKFFRSLIMLMYLISVSYIVTIILGLFVKIDNLYYFQLNIGNYHAGGSIYFPFTPLYGIMHTGDFAFPRYQLIFRESGIAQAFITWAIFNLKKYNLGKKRHYIVMHLGLLGTLSTIGIFIYFSTLAIYLLLKKKNKINLLRILKGGVVTAIALFLLYNTPFIGIKDKYVTHQDSFTDRFENSYNGIKNMINNPIGIGFQKNSAPNSGISIIAISQKIGFIGFIILILTFWLPIKYTNDKESYIINIFPIFLTALLAQPISSDPIIAIVLMNSIRNN
ncbi:hypothetical protein [Anoxybacillus eryuanensis]|uniref:hypothetical protein n=1 Tax=Anoxybacillus eryuanensis TaxID=651866 RepID=UPI003EF22F1A